MTKPHPYEPMSTKIWRWSALFAAAAILLGFATAITGSGRVGNCTGVSSIACLCLAIAGLIAKALETDREESR
ncbi:MAG TPA: hypothetical protein VGL05_19360 [Kribbella sp.]